MAPSERITAINRAPVRLDGDYVLYWMIATRRPHYNFALQRAVDHAVRLAKPLVVLEAIRVLRVRPFMAEFWDSPGKIVTSVKMAVAAITGGQPELGDNRKVSL